MNPIENEINLKPGLRKSSSFVLYYLLVVVPLRRLLRFSTYDCLVVNTLCCLTWCMDDYQFKYLGASF